jgi:hypothetical protein
MQTEPMIGSFGTIFLVIYLIWSIIYVIQAFFGYGTAYRFTRDRGNNGVALVGWLIVFTLAAIVPGLGIYLWAKYRD